jgi:transposase InsO family protein
MSISGNLETMELAELLQWVAQSGKTGTLVIGKAEVQKRIFFLDGRIIATGSTDPKEQLGHFLVSHGFINEQELVDAITQQESSGMLLGKILVTAGRISEQDLQDLLLLKAQEGIFDMFSWRAGEFRFVERETLDSGMIPIALDVAMVVLQGMERLDEWNRIHECVPSHLCVPVWIAAYDDSELSAGERHVLELVDDDRSIEDICIETHSSNFYVSRILAAAARTGAIKMVRPRVEIREATPENDSIDAGTLLETAGRKISNGDFFAALRHLRAARSLDPGGKETQRAILEAEERMKRVMREEGLSLKAVPQITVPHEEIKNLRLSPEEGFVLSRIDGNYDIESILKISPMPPLEAQLVFRKLLHAGHIELLQASN